MEEESEDQQPEHNEEQDLKNASPTFFSNREEEDTELSNRLLEFHYLQRQIVLKDSTCKIPRLN